MPLATTLIGNSEKRGASLRNRGIQTKTKNDPLNVPKKVKERGASGVGIWGKTETGRRWNWSEGVKITSAANKSSRPRVAIWQKIKWTKAVL